MNDTLTRFDYCASTPGGHNNNVLQIRRHVTWKHKECSAREKIENKVKKTREMRNIWCISGEDDRSYSRVFEIMQDGSETLDVISRPTL